MNLMYKSLKSNGSEYKNNISSYAEWQLYKVHFCRKEISSHKYKSINITKFPSKCALHH